jgi:hypothetical protein
MQPRSDNQRHTGTRPEATASNTTTKTPPDPAQIRALLDMAAMQSGVQDTGRSPYRTLVIVSIILAMLTAGLYAAVRWAAARY